MIKKKPSIVMPKKPGRPPESPNKDYDIVDAVLTACKRCGSTDRTPYNGVERYPQQYTHVNPQTRLPFNVIEFRPTSCTKCGQARRDRTEVLEERDG